MIEMFSRIFKPKFYKKCKSCVDTIKMTLEIIQRYRKADQRFLKDGIAEFLRRGLDYSAYERAAGLLLEYKRSSCYELVEKFIGCISDHLEDLSKQKDCPDECKEAVQSLIYGAAWFSDLPALRELRSLFTQKYGNSLEPYINKEFVEKLRKDLPAREVKVQLLHDIAGEFSIEWDSKALEQQNFRPPSVPEEWSQNNDGAIDIEDSSSGDETSSTDMSSQDGPKGCSSSSVGSVSEDEEAENKRPFFYRFLPPPYLKPKPKEEEKPKPRLARRRHLKSASCLSPQSTTLEASKGSRRAVSLLPEMPAMHVHPKLPDYDDVAARMASLKGR